MGLWATGLVAQTVVTPPKNKYTPKQDVELGRKAAAQVRQKYPIISDERIASYLGRLGRRLVAAAPPELNESVYEYSFTPVNLKEINAFALPGGPMFVHRGMFDAAAGEGEVAGVMAHELSHVLLRHGTANMTKAQNPWLQLGQIAGVLGGGAVGGAAGTAIAQGSQLGVGSVLLRYSREYEKQADILGAQIMARAGYDPRALAHMFETIERETQSSGGNGPQWLSSHPNPGNRTDYITKEAQLLSVAPAPDSSEFAPIKAAFASLPRGKSSSDLAKVKRPSGGDSLQSVGTPGQPVPPPSSEYRSISGGRIFSASVPINWTSLPSRTAIKVVPENGYGQLNGETIFSHGIEFGIAPARSRDLSEATNAWLSGFEQDNPEMKLSGTQQAVRISEQSALSTSFVKPSKLVGQERVVAYTTFLGDGTLFYYVTVVPENDAQVFEETFRHIGESIRLTARR